ncbi:MAG: insulinase family protein, partial [Gammaproteobacteria bacterium]
ILEHLRVAIERPGFIPGLAREWLRDNPHRVRVAMIPDTGFNARHAAQLKSRLAATKQSLSVAEKTRIIAHAAALKDRQQQAPDATLLPKVGVEDIPADFKVPASERTLLGGVPVTWFRQGTNGLVYEEITVELPALGPGELGLLSLYCNCVTELGYGDKDYLAAQTHQAAISGGIAAHCALRAEIQNMQRILAYYQLSSNCLASNHEALAQLLHDAFYKARFDELGRLRELMAQIRAARESAVTDQGHVLAMTAACAGFGPAAALSHRWDGLVGLRDLKALERAIQNQDKLEEFAAGLKRIHERLTRAAPQLLVVGEDQHLAGVGAKLASQWAAFQPPVHDAKPFSLSIEPSRVNEAWITNTEVNFCARAYPAVPSDHEDAAALIVLGRFLHNGYLHRAIREQGGAYGSGAAYDGDTGAFKFFSYRDPRVMETLEAFDAALEWLHRDGHGYEKLEEAILGVIAALDRPSSPAGEAIRTFAAGLFGRSPEYRRRLRQRVLRVTVADLQRVAQTYLVKERASTAIVTSSASLRPCAALNLETHAL